MYRMFQVIVPPSGWRVKLAHGGAELESAGVNPTSKAPDFDAACIRGTDGLDTCRFSYANNFTTCGPGQQPLLFDTDGVLFMEPSSMRRTSRARMSCIACRLSHG
jgi:hypothetical protein